MRWLRPRASNARSSCIPRTRPRRRLQSSRQWQRGRGSTPQYVVKHHSTPFTRREDTAGLVPSILAKEELVSQALKGGPRFLLETDYIDDPRRPGAVLGPATVPKKTKAWLERGSLTTEQAWSIHHDLPERTYRIQIN